ncbi:MAG: hypothetical protein R3C53_14930 [Pirellulaceae bacterium]
MVDLIIDGFHESFGRVWVHIQDPGTCQIVEYRVRVAESVVDSVFDATDKESGVSWDEYLREEVNELGTAMLSRYFSNMSQIAEATEEGYRWVIATLDSVIEDADGIELVGRAIPFESSKFMT